MPNFTFHININTIPAKHTDDKFYVEHWVRLAEQLNLDDEKKRKM